MTQPVKTDPASNNVSSAWTKIIKDLENGASSLGDRIQSIVLMVPNLVKMILLQAAWIKNLLKAKNKNNSVQPSQSNARQENDAQ